MNFFKKRAFCIFILSFFCGGAAISEQIPQSLSSYPRPILALMNALPRWSPSYDMTSACWSSLQKNKLDPSACKNPHKLNPISSFRSKLFFDFNIGPENGFQKIDFQLTQEIKIRGLLGLHEGQIRPLVIFRMGIHGNRDEFIAERYILKLLYEDLGYHVLTLESLTSHGFIKSNEQVSFGGFEEGLHTFFVLNQIKKNEFTWVKNISEIHLVALSMGGNGAFLTTYLDEHTNRQIKSVQMFCPLVNFQETFAHLEQPGFFNAFADFWNSMRLKALNTKNPNLAQVERWKMLFDLKPRYGPMALDWLNTTQQGPVLKLEEFEKKFPSIKWPKAFKEHVENSKDFFSLNNFWLVFKNEKTPIHIVTTRHDLFVDNNINVDRIRKGIQPGFFKKTSFLDLDGFHCSLAEEYQWPFLIEVVRQGLQSR